MQKPWSFYLKKILSFSLLTIVVIVLLVAVFKMNDGMRMATNDHAYLKTIVDIAGLISFFGLPVAGLAWIFALIISYFILRESKSVVASLTSLGQSAFMRGFYKYLAIIALIIAFLSVFVGSLFGTSIWVFIALACYYFLRRGINTPATITDTKKPTFTNQEDFLRSFNKYFFLIVLILSPLSIFMGVVRGVLIFILVLAFYRYRRDKPLAVAQFIVLFVIIVFNFARSMDGGLAGIFFLHHCYSLPQPF